MISKQTIVAFIMAIFGSAVLAQSGDQIVSLMRSGEFEAARKMSLRLIKNNDPIAFYTLGYLDYRKKTPDGDKSAFKYMLQAAKLNNLSAMSRVGDMYLKGIGIKKDLLEAENWLLKASERGHERAIYNLGLYFYGHYGGEQKPQLALEQFLKIINLKELEQTETWVISAFYIGMLTVNSNEQRGKEISESAFSEVLKSKLTTQQVNWAKKEIAILVEKNLTKAGQGDGTDDDKLCQNFGFQVLSIEYSQCRLKVDIAKREQVQKEAAYQAEMARYQEEQRRYEAQVAEYERQKERQKGLALLRFGAALAGGTSPHFSENLANANRSLLGMQPIQPQRPSIQNFTITNRNRMTNCTVFGNVINCN